MSLFYRLLYCNFFCDAAELSEYRERKLHTWVVFENENNHWNIAGQICHVQLPHAVDISRSITTGNCMQCYQKRHGTSRGLERTSWTCNVKLSSVLWGQHSLELSRVYCVLCFMKNVIKLKQFPLNWPFVRAIDQSRWIPPHKGQWRGALVFSLICVWINGWVNNLEADDLRRHRGHYDVIVMWCGLCRNQAFNAAFYGLLYRIYASRVSSSPLPAVTDGYYTPGYIGFVFRPPVRPSVSHPVSAL